MSSTENFVKTVRDRLKVRPILPFGLPLSIGTIGVLEDDEFVIRGGVGSILGVDVGETVTGEEPVNWSLTSGDDVQAQFVAAGEASRLFPGSPTVKARLDVSFKSSQSFIVSARGVQITTLKDPHRLIGDMISGWRRGVFREDFVLVNQVVVADRVAILCSRESDTNLQLEANADTGPVTIGDIAGKFSISYQSRDILRLDGRDLVTFYNGLKVDTDIWGNVDVGLFEEVPEVFVEA